VTPVFHPRFSSGDNASPGVDLNLLFDGKRPGHGGSAKRSVPAVLAAEGAGVGPRGHPAEFSNMAAVGCNHAARPLIPQGLAAAI